jgi:hypothetical protein
MKPLILAFISVLAISSATAAQLREPREIIREEGQFVFSDGASFFLFRKDGTFKSAPHGLSGRVITGRWKFQSPGRFTIEGRWSWVNGLSPRDDFRRMTLVVSSAQGFEEKQQVSAVELTGPVKVYKCYFTVDEVVKVTPPDDVK